jgi:hypothetical protein
MARPRRETIMPDPVTLAVLGGVAANEGIKFLYGQAAELLKAWRERRNAISAGYTAQPELIVPIVDNAVLNGTLAQPIANATVVDRESAAFVHLAGALSPYAQGLADVDPGDQQLSEQAAQLRALLEAAYGQRFTFHGEQREPTGTHVTVTQALSTVKGAVTGADVDVSRGTLDIVQGVTTVESGGSVTGVKGRIGP